MIMNNLHELKYDTTRGKVITLRGEELEIKEHISLHSKQKQDEK